MASVGIPLPPPFKGQNDQVPTFALENPFCETMQNFNTTAAYVALRKGHSRFASLSNAANIKALAIKEYGNKLFMLIDFNSAGLGLGLQWYDISSGTPTLVHSTAVTLNGDTRIETLYFNKYLFFFGDASLAASGPVFYNGTSWGTSTWTFPGGGTPFGGAVYKNRAYIIDLNTADFFYTAIDGIGGATTRVSLASIVSENATLVAIKSVSLSENVTQENLLAFLFSNGEILLYSGSYPNSESWQIVARLRTSPLVNVNSCVDSKGDTFLLTRTEILSLRNLVAKGYSAERAEGIGVAIENRYREILNNVNRYQGFPTNLQYVKGCHDPKNDRLIISFPRYIVDVDAGQFLSAHQLIFDFTTGTWFEYYQNDPLIGSANFPTIEVRDITAWKQEVYYLSYAFNFITTQRYVAVYQLEGKTNFLDDGIVSATTAGIEYKLKSAPHPLNRFGVVKTDGLEVIMKSDLYSTANWKLVADLGATETAAQLTSGNGTNVTKTFVNLGIESNLVQYQLTGTSSGTGTVGLEIYGTNLWVNPSQGVAR